MKAYNEIKKELEARKDRSAWSTVSYTHLMVTIKGIKLFIQSHAHTFQVFVSIPNSFIPDSHPFL